MLDEYDCNATGHTTLIYKSKTCGVNQDRIVTEVYTDICGNRLTAFDCVTREECNPGTMPTECDTNDCYLDTKTCTWIVNVNAWFKDKDGDGYGNPNELIHSLNQPSGFVEDNTDCDDNNTNVHKLNKCEKCEAEPVSGSCESDELPCNTFNERIKDILVHEGGYVNNPNDPGKATNKGVSWPVWEKNAQSILNLAPTLANLQALTDNQAGMIYKKLYWDKIYADDIIDGDLRYLLFDFYVNAGGNATKVMQKTLNQLGNNLIVDGAMGNDTLNAINSAEIVELYNNFRINRQLYYEKLANGSSKLATFLKGWTNRVNKFNNKTNTNKTNVNCD